MRLDLRLDTRIAQGVSPRAMIRRPVDTVADAAERIAAERVGALGVCAGDRLVGIISEHDLVRAVADGVDPHEVPVDACATWGVHTAPLDERTTTVAHRMLDLAVRCMPAVHRGRVIGVV